MRSRAVVVGAYRGESVVGAYVVGAVVVGANVTGC